MLKPRDLRDLESPRALGCSVPSGSEGATKGPRGFLITQIPRFQCLTNLDNSNAYVATNKLPR